VRKGGGNQPTRREARTKPSTPDYRPEERKKKRKCLGRAKAKTRQTKTVETNQTKKLRKKQMLSNMHKETTPQTNGIRGTASKGGLRQKN